VSWRYEQATGKMTDPSGELVGIGYSGGDCGTAPEGKNNPAMQNVPMVGPIPQGIYTIGPAYTHSRLGPVTMNLYPSQQNQMFDRDAFRIHGDNPNHIGESSDGCIVLARDVREMISESRDLTLEVVSGLIS